MTVDREGAPTAGPDPQAAPGPDAPGPAGITDTAPAQAGQAVPGWRDEPAPAWTDPAGGMGLPGAQPGLAAPVAPKRRSRGPLLAVLAVAAGLGAFAIKVLPSVLIGVVASGVLDGVFGGPFQRLPADQRQSLNARVEAAVGSSLDGLPPAERTARMEALIADGMVRLDDAHLIEHLTLYTAMLDRVDLATCAAFARVATMTLAERTPLVLKGLAVLDTNQVGRWFELNVAAVEAASKGAPKRAATEAAISTAYDELFGLLSDADLQILSSAASGGTVGDTDACEANRHIYDSAPRLSPPSLATLALVDVTP